MRKYARDNRPYLKPVTRIQLSEKNIKVRFILLVICLAVAATALFAGVRELLKVEPGWQEIQISSKQPNCAGEFVLMYDFSDYGGSAAAANKDLTALYTEAAETGWLLFSPEGEAEAVHNLHYLNRHVNEVISVEPALYEALRLVVEAGNRNLYLAPAYVEYDRIFLCENEEEAVRYDPAFNEELESYLRELAAFASDPAHIDLELLEDDKVRLSVSAEYLSFAEEYELDTLVDFGWMKNAFLADYLAQVLTDKGYTAGYLTSYDGFTRNLDPRGGSYTLNFFAREGTDILMPARIGYTGPQSVVSLRDFPMSEEDRWHYFAYGSGHITSVFLDPADGLSKPATSSLTGLSEDRSCAQILLDLIPVFIAGEFDAAPLVALAQEGTDTVWYQGAQVHTTNPSLLQETP